MAAAGSAEKAVAMAVAAGLAATAEVVWADAAERADAAMATTEAVAVPAALQWVCLEGAKAVAAVEARAEAAKAAVEWAETRVVAERAEAA